MTHDDPHDRFAELAAGHALFALEPEDEQVFQQHLGTCARCPGDVRAHQATLSDLAYAVEDLEPPAVLLDRIRVGVGASDRPAMWGEPSADTVPSAGAGFVVRLSRRRPPARAVLAVAAASAVLLGLGGWNLTLRDQRANQLEANSRVAAAVHELGTAGSRPVALRAGDGAVLAVALLKGSDLTLLVDGLPANDAGSTYVLWARVGVELRAVGAFDTGGGGLDVRDHLRIPGDASRLSDLMVTVERGRIAPHLPRTPVLAAWRA